MIQLATFARIISVPELKEGTGKRRMKYASFRAAADACDDDGVESTLAIKVLAFGDCLDEALSLRLEDRVFIEGDCSISIWNSKGVAKPSVTVRAHHLRRPRIGERREPTAEALSVAAALSQPIPIEELPDLPAFIRNKPQHNGKASNFESA
jgi:hypothetical protein